ncbi:MAG: type II toxin-antitoxin system PemK/MazF family toxin [Akkermansiaceae bacterium]|nr:type II toxin-antitoxin system PemK/MazF family toxin [Akkermansiaceae bacterium]MCF7731349.1 type II toxin-antitoxin system PemK/MazF family toxin [Akkermansiaceae bacterium]
MNTEPTAGEVWFADLGMAAKSRPVLILAYPQRDDARSLVVVAPLTSQIRRLRGEVEIGKPRWLPKLSAVNIQGLASFDRHFLVRKMGTLDCTRMESVKGALRELLDL